MEHVLPKAGQLFFSLTCCSPHYLHRILYLLVLYASPLFICWLYFFLLMNCTNSIHVSTVKLTLWSISNNLCFKAGSCIPSIKCSMINSSSVVISPVPSLSNSQYLALSFNRCTNCIIDSLGCYLFSRNFVLSAMTNLFFGLIFLFITSLISLKVSSSRFLVGYHWNFLDCFIPSCCEEHVCNFILFPFASSVS